MPLSTWDLLTDFGTILSVFGPLSAAFAAALGFVWRQWWKIGHLEEALQKARNANRAYVGGQHNIDGIIPNAEAAKAKIMELITNEISVKGRPLRIDNYGLDLETVHSMFRYTFSARLVDSQVFYRGLVIDPDSPYIASVTHKQGNIQTTTARNVLHQLAQSQSSFANEFPHLSIEIRSYWFPPVMHGFLIGEEHLIMGMTHFHRGGLMGGENSYVYLRRDASSKFKSDLFLAYESWFGYWWHYGKRQIALNGGR
jgi:hypothetical protein